MAIINPLEAEPKMRRTVMVVDADVLSRMAIADYLRHCGYSVLEGSSAEDVDAVLTTEREIDVMLIDLTLSGTQDGFSLARKVRAEHPDIVVILTSSAAKQAEKAGELCDDGPLMKPYNPAELERRIKLLRERRRLHEATRDRPFG
jgi:DNA-binding response OmpR family regulator